MRKLFGAFLTVCLLLFVSLVLFFPQPAAAADIRTGEQVTIPQNETSLKDLYLFGSDVQVYAPVTNDVVTAGGNIILNDKITNDLIAGGGTVMVRGRIGNSARIAGGTITIEGPVTGDLVVAGGTVNISKTASIGGDLLFAGGRLQLDGPVRGKILMSGGDITLNSSVSGNITAGDVNNLTLGPQARIKGNLTYNSPKPASEEAGSIILGQTTFHRIAQREENKKQPPVAAAIGTGIYALIIDIVLSLLLIYFFRSGLLVLFTHIQKAPWKSLGIGFAYAVLTPLASLILLILIWLGIASFLLYGLSVLVSMYLAKVFVGWWINSWWENRKKRVYQLDWKAGILGPVVMFLLSLIPFLGWLASVVIYLIALGAFVILLINQVPRLQEAKKT